MRKPLIGLTCGIRDVGDKQYYGLLPSYTHSVALAGGLPVMIAPNADEDVLRGIYERLDGVVITGGGDVDPSFYGAINGGQSKIIDRTRDVTELNVARWAASDNKPAFGICRGVQVMNVALGGTLWQDIPTEFPGHDGIDHDLWGKFPRHQIAHTVSVTPDTRLAKAVGTTQPEVNSMHHQALRDLGQGLVQVASSPDGVVEGVEIPDAKFFVGVQWHPEELVDYSEPMRRLFQSFVDAAGR